MRKFISFPLINSLQRERGIRFGNYTGWFFLGMSIFNFGCSSTQTRAAPTLALDAIDIAAGAATGGFHSGTPNGDFKYQITVKGRVTSTINCFFANENLAVEVLGPLPLQKVVASTGIKNDETYEIITTAEPGSYEIHLVNNRGGQIIQSKVVRAAEQDRFDVSFFPCPSDAAHPQVSVHLPTLERRSETFF